MLLLRKKAGCQWYRAIKTVALPMPTALIVTVTPEDFQEQTYFRGMDFQRRLEKRNIIGKRSIPASAIR